MTDLDRALRQIGDMLRDIQENQRRLEAGLSPSAYYGNRPDTYWNGEHWVTRPLEAAQEPAETWQGQGQVEP